MDRPTNAAAVNIRALSPKQRREFYASDDFRSLDVRERLRIRLDALEPEEVYDLVERLMPKKLTDDRVILESEDASHVVNASLVVLGKKLASLMETYGRDNFFRPDFGFIAGPARDEYLAWYIERYATDLQRRRPLALENLKMEAFVAARRVFARAKLF